MTAALPTARPLRLIAAMCLAEVLSMAGAFTFPALLPVFRAAWGLNNTQAGWINGAYYAGYTVAVAILAGLTDRVDARRIFLAAVIVSGFSALGFALAANGFYSALIFRLLGGLGMAGTFIPGLKALVDRLDGPAQARGVSFYTATFSLGMSLSFFAAGCLDKLWGWPWAFGISGVIVLSAWPVAALALRAAPSAAHQQRTGLSFLDFRPILKNRRAMAYILAYSAHMWEMFAFRSWIVAFLVFNLAGHSLAEGGPAPTTIASLAGLIAMWASIGGAELALRYGRQRVLMVIMTSSALFGCVLGFLAGLPYQILAGLCIVYSLFLQGDSAALHTGVIQAAEADRRGATMALQSLMGFGCASLGSMAVGFFLDLTGGGQNAFSWGMAFVVMGAGAGLGPLFIGLLGREKSVR